MDNHDPVISELRKMIDELDEKADELQKEMGKVTDLLQDDPRYGRKGLLSAFQEVRSEQGHLRQMLDGFERREQERDREAKETAQRLEKTVTERALEVRTEADLREKKRDRFFVWVFGMLGTIIAGLIVTGVGVYLNVVVGAP